ncbi:COP9 signalosome complex subunit 4 [Sparganum proliferum]
MDIKYEDEACATCFGLLQKFAELEKEIKGLKVEMEKLRNLPRYSSKENESERTYSSTASSAVLTEEKENSRSLELDRNDNQCLVREKRGLTRSQRKKEISGQLRGDLIKTYRIVRSRECALDFDEFFELAGTDRLRGHPFKLQRKRARSDVRRNAFSHRRGHITYFAYFKMDISEEINSELDAIITEKVPLEAVARFGRLLKTFEGRPEEFILHAISKISNAISQDAVTVISARQICGELITYIDKSPSDQMAISAFQILLSRMQSRVIAFEAQLTELRDLLARRLSNSGDLREAAVVLSGIPLESGQRSYSVLYKLDVYLRIVECYLTLGCPTQAELYINRASLLQSECQDQHMIMRFKSAYARLLDFKQKFLEAGQRYAELSIRFPWLKESEKMAFLERALLSALLAGVGQQRARLLTTLYKDERCQSLQAYPILEKMYMRRLISRNCLQSLEPLFIKYYPQLFFGGKSDENTPMDAGGQDVAEAAAAAAPGAGGEAPTTSASARPIQNILERVTVEHNMLAASLIYNNISLSNLGELLEVDASRAETVAAHMIGEGRLVAQIDQIDGFIHFEKQNATVASLSSQIESLCASVNRIVEGIEADHPSWVATQHI